MTDTTPITHPKRRATDQMPRLPFTMPVPPADARLVALCAELGSNERERRRLIALLPFQAGTLAGLREAANMRADLVQLTGARQGLIWEIIPLKARTIDGIRTKAAVVRLLVADLPTLGNVRLDMADSLAADVVQVLA